MKFTIDCASFTKGLGLPLGVITPKTTIPILGNFLIETDQDTIRITGTDLELAAISSLPAEVKQPGKACIPAKRLTEIVRSLSEDELTVTALENHWVSVISGRAKFKLAGLSPDNFPTIPQSPPDSINLPASILCTALRQTLFAVTKEESRYTINGVLLALDAQGLRLVATDGHRLALSVSPLTEQSKSQSLLVPRDAAALLLRLLSDAKDDATVTFASNDSHIFFGLGDQKLISRRLAGQFPNYEAVLPKDNNVVVTVRPEVLATALHRVATLADERSNFVKLALKAGNLEVSASTLDGEAQDLIDTEYTGPEFSIGFNVRYLLDFLGVVTAAGAKRVQLTFKDESSAAEFTPVEGGYRYIIMPLRG